MSKCPAAYTVGPPPPEGVRRLHLNEFRFEHHPLVTTAWRDAAAQADLAQYVSGPDDELVAALAEYVGVSPSNVAVAPGSDEVLRATIEIAAAAMPGRPLLMGVPGYAHFEHFARLRDIEMVTYGIGLGTSAEDHQASLRYHDDIMREGCLVYLCSPNNPTGDMWSPAVVRALATQYPASLFLVDEAYIEFALVDEATVDKISAVDNNAEAKSSVASVAATLENVVVARTMSKAFGLAALRIGYAVARPALIARFRSVINPKAFSHAANAAAKAVLACRAYYLGKAKEAMREMGRVCRRLASAGWYVHRTPGNFYLIFVGDTKAAVTALAERGVQVRDRGDMPGLAGFVRVTAGTADDSEAVLRAFAALPRPVALPPQTYHAGKGRVAELKALTKRCLAVLAAQKVEVWAQSGTMLGMVRHARQVEKKVPNVSLLTNKHADGTTHLGGVRMGSKTKTFRVGGMIPWDDDVDLAYARGADGADPLAALVPAFAAAGLTLQRNRTDAYWQVGMNAAGATISPAHVDIFSYSPKTEDSSYRLDDPRFCEEEPDSPQAHCNTRYTHDELYPLRRDHVFYDVVIAMPAQAEKVLLRALGPDYMTVAKIRVGEKLVVVDLHDLSPA
jgi:histidinol-phosphate aminotransferase